MTSSAPSQPYCSGNLESLVILPTNVDGNLDLGGIATSSHMTRFAMGNDHEISLYGSIETIQDVDRFRELLTDMCGIERIYEEYEAVYVLEAEGNGEDHEKSMLRHRSRKVSGEDQNSLCYFGLPETSKSGNVTLRSRTISRVFDGNPAQFLNALGMEIYLELTKKGYIFRVHRNLHVFIYKLAQILNGIAQDLDGPWIVQTTLTFQDMDHIDTHEEELRYVAQTLEELVKLYPVDPRTFV